MLFLIFGIPFNVSCFFVSPIRVGCSCMLWGLGSWQLLTGNVLMFNCCLQSLFPLSPVSSLSSTVCFCLLLFPKFRLDAGLGAHMQCLAAPCSKTTGFTTTGFVSWICFLDLFLDFSWICFLTTGTAECTAVMKRRFFCLGCYCRCSFYWYHAIMILLFFLRRILVLVLVVLVILVVAILLFLVAAVFLVADRVFVFCFCCLLQLWNHSFFVKCHLKIR